MEGEYRGREWHWGGDYKHLSKSFREWRVGDPRGESKRFQGLGIGEHKIGVRKSALCRVELLQERDCPTTREGQNQRRTTS